MPHIPMVQFVFTPWRDRAELLRVRGQLYPRLTLPLDNNDNNVAAAAAIAITPPSPWWSSPEELRGAEAAVARVLMWVNRGGCPHVVESTALLMSAMVFDARGGHDAIAGAAVAAGYLVGFTRWVFCFPPPPFALFPPQRFPSLHHACVRDARATPYLGIYPLIYLMTDLSLGSGKGSSRACWTATRTRRAS